MKKILQIENLSFSYTQKKLIENLNFSVYSGHSLWLQGKNGSGKTTLLKILSGFIKVQKGKYFISSSFNTLFLEQSLYKILSLKENFHFFKSLYKSTLYDELIDFFDLHEQLALPYESLSQGQKMRAKLVQTFLKPASLYLLDEPFVALDEGHQQQLVNFLQQKKEQGISFLIASHQNISSQLFDDVYTL